MPRARLARLARLGRTIGVGLVGLVVLAVVLVLGASVILQGPRLGRLIEGALPPNAGKMHIGGVTWHLRALIDLVTDAPSPIAVEGLQIVDPEGTVVLDVPSLEAKVRLRSLIGGSFSIHALRIPKGRWRFSQLKHGAAIGFLAALAPKTPPPPLPPGAPPPPGSKFEITDAELGDFTVDFDFPGVWGLELRHIHGTASLIQSTLDPAHPIFGFDARSIVAEGGWLRILGDNVLPFERVVIKQVATTQDRPDDIQLDLTEADTGRSRLTAKGAFTGIYGATSTPGVDLRLAFAHVGDALTAVAAGKGLAGLAITGDDATITANLTQPFARIKVAAALRGLDVRYGDARALGLGLDLGFDAGAGRVDVTRFGLGAPGGGKLSLDAHLDLATLALDAALGLNRFHTESYLPRGLRPLAGGRLDGEIVAHAELAKKAVQLQKIDLRFARAGARGLPRTVRVRGAADLSPERVRTRGVTVSVAGAEATARGSIDLDRQLVDLALGVVASDLGRLCGALGLPALAKDARLDVHARGRIDDPIANGTAAIHGLGAGVRRVRQLDAHFGLANGVARLDRLSGPAFGGSIDAHGSLRLWTRSAKRPLKSPVVDLGLVARDLDLAMLAPQVGVTGHLTVTADARGPLDALTAHVRIPAGTPVGALGEQLSVGPVNLTMDGKALAVQALHLAHRGGGTLDVHGRVGLAHQDLDLNVTLARFPIAAIPGVAHAGVPMSGFVSAKLHVTGRPDRPELAGDLDLAEVVVRGISLGKGHLVLTPAPVGPQRAPGVAIHGRLFDRFAVDVEAALLPKGPSVHGRIAFQRLELHTLAPELVALGDGRSVASGRVTVDLEPGQPLALDVLLPELWMSLARAVDGPNGETTMQRIRIEAARPVHVHLVGDHIALDEAHFSTDGGDLRVEGRLDGRAISGALSGHLDLELLQPFLGDEGPIERLGGDLRADLRAAGTLDHPDLRGEVVVASPIHVRARELYRDLVVNSGRFALTPGGGVSIENLALSFDGSTMKLGGRATLGPGFVPENLQADVDGDVSARLLAYAAPDVVTDAQGKAHVHAHLQGTLLKPDIQGRLDLNNVAFRLRDLGSEVQVESGTVEVSNEGLVLRNVKVMFDDQGLLVIGASGVRDGRVQFTSLFPFRPGYVDLPLHGERLTYRSPGVFEVDDLAFDLDLKGSVQHGFGLGGQVRLVSGRYLQDFQVQNLALRPRIDESTVRPFYDGRPLLEQLHLDLSVRTVGDGFVVQNNLAPEIHADIILHVGGTLAVPQLAGEIRPTDGRFDIPFMRGDFDLVPNVNHVTFIATKSISDGDTPDIEIEATNLVTDGNGTDHNVHMRISGPLREAQIDLWSDDGLDRNQTAFLLLTGRTSVSNTSPFGTQNATVGSNLTTGADLAGQATRDTVANLMEPYIDDTFQRLTGLNLRLTVGSDGFEGRIRKRVSRYGDLQFDYLQGFQDQSHWNGSGNLWLLDYFSLGGGIEQIRLSSEQGVPETLPLNYNFELRLDYAIR